MTNEQAEKEWAELVDKAAHENFHNAMDWEDFERGAQFVRANLSQVPEIKNVIHSLKTACEYLESTGCQYIEDYSPEREMLMDLTDQIKKLEGVK